MLLYSDYIPMHDTSKAIDSRREPSLGSDSFVHTFAHINHVNSFQTSANEMD